MYPSKISVGVTQVLDLAYCGVTSSSITWTRVSAIPELVNGAVMCILVIFQFVKRVVEMYKVTKTLHFNRYMNLLAGQSILYFLFIFFFNRTAILIALRQFQTEGWPTLALLPIEYVPAFALTPRFIMSVRALHPGEPQGSQGHDIDAGSGLSRSRLHDRETMIVLAIRQRETELDVEIPMEEWSITMEPSDGVA
ncbi:hypothetical protein J3R82DRAFT_6407 [Butyriboletus roseoflavus]|nr:hypothetical protein J3R82DRAFT_6407 [Butyriboletus roseoflavus]